MRGSEECAENGVISERDFEDHWGVYVRPDGDFFQYEEIVDAPLEYVWTVVDSGWDEDGNWYALPGLHIVNKLGYVKTRRPWDEHVEQAIYFLDDFEDTDETEERVA